MPWKIDTCGFPETGRQPQPPQPSEQPLDTTGAQFQLHSVGAGLPARGADGCGGVALPLLMECCPGYCDPCDPHISCATDKCNEMHKYKLDTVSMQPSEFGQR